MIDEFPQRLPTWLRWLLVPVTPVVTFGVINLAGNLLAKAGEFFFFNNGTMTARFFTVVIVQGIAAAQAVEMTAAMAPRAKHGIVYALCVLLVLICGFGMTWYGITQQWGPLLEGLPFLAGVVVGGASHCKEKAPRVPQLPLEPQAVDTSSERPVSAVEGPDHE